MAVVEIHEHWVNRSGSIDASLTREYTRVFRVRTDDQTDEPRAVVKGAYRLGMPKLGARYKTDREADPRARVVNIQATQESAHPKFWIITLTYRTPDKADTKAPTGSAPQGIDPDQRTSGPDDVQGGRSFKDLGGGGGGGGGKGSVDRPTSRPAEIEMSFSTYQKVAVNGYIWEDGGQQPNEAILNSAADPFDPPPMIDDSRGQLTVTRNYADMVPVTLATYMNKVNSKPFAGFPEFTVKMSSIRGRLQYEDGQFYWRVTMGFEYRESIGGSYPWHLKLLDAGFNEWKDPDDLTKGKKPILVNGQPATVPQLLDGGGAVLSIPANGRPNVQYREYVVYELADFNGLGLFDTF